jgi:hypothetical protein
MSAGIIIRIDWNENNWEKPSVNLEYAKNFEYVKDNNISFRHLTLRMIFMKKKPMDFGMV